MQPSYVKYNLKSNYNDHAVPFHKTKKKGAVLKPNTQFKKEYEIDYNRFITEDDEPVDNLFSERQQRLLPESLYASWNRDKPFLASSNVGIYEKNPTTPIVPDMFLSLDVTPAKDIWEKKHRCYFISIFGKPPELVIEIVSNKVGQEKKTKRMRYQKMGVKYYVIYDPGLHIFKTTLHAYQLIDQAYVAFSKKDIQNKRLWFDDLNIGLTIQKGKYEELNAEWLRWYDSGGNILKTGKEKAEDEKEKANNAVIKMIAEKNRADSEKNRADSEKNRADSEKNRADSAENLVESEKNRADAAENRADAAEKELALLKAKLSLS